MLFHSPVLITPFFLLLLKFLLYYYYYYYDFNWYCYYLFLTFMFWLLLLQSFLLFVKRVIANEQRLTEYSRLYISNTFLSILAVPNKAIFCITPTLHFVPSFPTHLSNSAETLPRAPITSGTISTVFNF